MKRITPRKKNLVLFDIDGTLLLSKHLILRNRFFYAVEKVYGVKNEGPWEMGEGSIDKSAFMELARKGGIDEETIQKQLPLVYEEAFLYFSQNIPSDYKESILPGSLELLTKLRKKVHLGILTGNVEKIGWKKVEMVGLRDFFEFGLFGHEADTRNELARLVFERAKAHYGKEFPAKDIIFVGDTPKDIECARAINAKVLAVATGKYSLNALQQFGPDLAVTSLTDKRVLKFLTNI